MNRIWLPLKNTFSKLATRSSRPVNVTLLNMQFMLSSACHHRETMHTNAHTQPHAHTRKSAHHSRHDTQSVVRYCTRTQGTAHHATGWWRHAIRLDGQLVA